MRILLLSSLLVMSSACQSLQSVSLTQIPAQRNKKIEAEASRFIFFGMNFNNDYVDTLVEELKDKCEGGVVRGILTKDVAVNYFLMLLHTRKITATGYCLPGKNSKLSLLESEP